MHHSQIQWKRYANYVERQDHGLWYSSECIKEKIIVILCGTLEDLDADNPILQQ